MLEVIVRQILLVFNKNVLCTELFGQTDSLRIARCRGVPQYL